MGNARPLFQSPLVLVKRIDHPVHLPDTEPAEDRSERYSINFVDRGRFALAMAGRHWTIGLGDVFLTHSLSRLARAAGMSPYHFARIFRELAGMPPHRLLLRRRLQAAVERLRGGESVTATCYGVGFGGLSHFIHAFRAAYGSSPSKYRLPRGAAVGHGARVHQGDRWRRGSGR